MVPGYGQDKIESGSRHSQEKVKISGCFLHFVKRQPTWLLSKIQILKFNQNFHAEHEGFEFLYI